MTPRSNRLGGVIGLVLVVVVVVTTCTAAKPPPSLGATGNSRSKQHHRHSPDNKKWKPQHPSSKQHAASKTKPTLVTGYGSLRHSILEPPSHDETSRKTPTTLWLSETTNDPSTAPVVLRLHSVPHNCTVEFLSNGTLIQTDVHPPQLNFTTTTYNNNNPSRRQKHVAPQTTTNAWVPIQGLWGVYTVPTGKLWVWVVHTEPVYQAPGLPDHSDWWNIRRVTQLHVTHRAHNPNEYTNKQQRHEQRRQLQLLRKALKAHDWYYYYHANKKRSSLSDMTRRLQDCFANHTRANDRQGWWQQNKAEQQQRPDSRFFWNEEQVAPLEELYQQQQQRQLENNNNNNKQETHNDKTAHILLEHVIPVTSAFVGVQQNLTVVQQPKTTKQQACFYDELLISRRSRFRAGTRFTTRGADATGAVANYVETEQIVVLWTNDTTAAASLGCSNTTTTTKNTAKETAARTLVAIASHVQTRGSIPIRWSSPTDIKTYRPRVRIGTNPLAQARAMRQHLVDQTSRYLLPTDSDKKKSAGLLFVNLIDKKSDQKRLGRALDTVMKAVLDVYTQHPDPKMPWLSADHVEHLWWDFHAEVKAGRWDRLGRLLDQVKPYLQDHGYFWAVPAAAAACSDNNTAAADMHNTTGTAATSSRANETASWMKVQKVQTGVVRTNCMDCLDRTNVVQSMFGRYMLFTQLSSFKMAAGVPLAFKTAMRKSPMTLPWASGEVAHRLLWADNADSISRLYAGTPALKGDFTRTGKRTKKGALDDGMNSLQRYYLNNFLDADRQEGLDLLTGFQPFSNIGRFDEEEDDDEDDSVSLSPLGKYEGLSIQEAARQMLLGFPMGEYNPHDERDEDHVRIKLSMDKKAPSSRSLELLWLPGDLRSHLRSLALSSSPALSFSKSSQKSDPAVQSDSDDTFCSRSALEDVDRRSEAVLPWWVTAEESSGSEDETEEETDAGTDTDSEGVAESVFDTKRITDIADAEASAINNGGYLLGALVAGAHSPRAMAALVLGLVAITVPFELRDDDSEVEE